MNVGEKQRNLSLKAEQDKEHRFRNLYATICDMDWLRLAHDYVAQNAGNVTAGCDGINMKVFDEDLERNLQGIAEELKSKNFQPHPVRRVHIPKSNGALRPLGIPSIRDRIVQEAARMILEPIYEADFSQYSFGFRPNRCTMDAIKCITWNTQENKKFFWVIEGDISSYFDTINHRRLMDKLRDRIEDKRMLNLIWSFLRAGVMENKLFRDTKLGTPQGGIISPLLANIYLHELDKYMERYLALPGKEKTRRRQNGLSNYTYVRYADDFVGLCNGTREQAEEMKEELYQFLNKELRLTLSREKTEITHLNEGFKFLGFWIQRMRGHHGMTPKVLIPKEALDNVKNKIARALDPGTYQDSMNTKILALNRIIGGWCRYYQYTSKASTEFGDLEYDTFWKMAHWLGRKYKLAMSDVLRRFRRDGTFATSKRRLIMPTEYKTRQYWKRFQKPNPYTTQEVRIQREEVPTETHWTGYEKRPGMEDIIPHILRRDGYTCQICGNQFPRKLEVDHIRPVRRFRRPIDANSFDNLQTVCSTCHRVKTEYDRQMESRVQGNLQARFGEEYGETYRPCRTKRVRSFVRKSRAE